MKNDLISFSLNVGKYSIFEGVVRPLVNQDLSEFKKKLQNVFNEVHSGFC